jgi:hypothetical protein
MSTITTAAVAAFLMKGMRNHPGYNTAIGLFSDEIEMITDLVELTVTDLYGYVEHGPENITNEEKYLKVCEAAGEVLIEYMCEVLMAPNEEDWSLILKVLISQAEGRERVLEILGYVDTKKPPVKLTGFKS